MTRPGHTPTSPDQVATSYDSNGNLWKQTDARSKTTTYGYDMLDRLTSVTDPLSRVLSTTVYDGASRPVQVTQPADGGGTLVTTMSYDKAGQLKGVDYSGSTPDVSYGYDAAGRRVSMTDGTGTSTFTYDTLDRLTKVINGAGAQVQYGYDLADRMLSLTYPGSAGSVGYGYDNADRMTSMTDLGTRQTSFGYDDNGAWKTATYPNGVTGTTLRDKLGRITSITDVKAGTTIGSFGYTYKDSSLINTTTQTGTPGANQTIGWTPKQQVQTVTGGTAAQGAGGYTFDLSDNLTGLPGITQTFDDAGQILTRTPQSGAATTYTYTARGERKTATTGSAVDQFGWDAAGRLTSVTPATGAAYTYWVDGTGLRTSVTTGGSTKQWTWDTSTSLPSLLSDGDSWFLYGPGGAPIEQQNRTTGQVQFLHSDALGSTRLLTDLSGTVTASFAYTPFGQLAGKTGTGDTSLRFAGQYTDPTGFIYLRARIYDPTTGAFLSRDPITPDTRDAYGYVGGNPMQESDPSGLASSNEPYWYLGLEEVPFPGPRPPISPDYRPIQDIYDDLMCGAISAATYRRQLLAYEIQASWLLQWQLWSIQDGARDRAAANDLGSSFAYMADRSGGRCVAGVLSGGRAWMAIAASGPLGLTAACTTAAGGGAVLDLFDTFRLPS